MNHNLLKSLNIFFGQALRAQFSTPRFTNVLKGRLISMDGRGRWMDNLFIERFRRSLKYECVNLHAFEGGAELDKT